MQTKNFYFCSKLYGIQSLTLHNKSNKFYDEGEETKKIKIQK